MQGLSVFICAFFQSRPAVRLRGHEKEDVMSTSLRLFYSNGACSLAPHIVLEETGAPFETIRIDMHPESSANRTISVSIPKVAYRRSLSTTGY